MRFDAFLVGEITIDGAKDFCEQLISKTPRKDISIFLSSEGGDVNGALTMGAAIQAVQRQGRKVHIHVGGCAYSSGVLLLQFADRRTMEPYTSLLIHPHNFAPPKRAIYTISDLNGFVDDLSFGEYCYFEVLQRRTGYDLHELLNKAHYRKQEILLFPRDCLKWNLVDEILPYALPECQQDTPVPSDDSIDNVIPLPHACQTISGAAQKQTSRTRSRKA